MKAFLQSFFKRVTLKSDTLIACKKEIFDAQYLVFNAGHQKVSKVEFDSIPFWLGLVEFRLLVGFNYN